MAQAIQFRGVSAVITAYKLNGIGPWAVICGTVIVAACEAVDNDDVEQGSESLEAFLLEMKKFRSEGRYTLGAYKLQPGQEIDPKMKPHRGFIFTLYEQDEAGPATYTKMYAVLEELSHRMAALEESRQAHEETEEERGVMGKIGAMAESIISQPQVQQAIAMGAMNLVQKVFKMPIQSPAQAPGKVAGIDQAAKKNLLDEAQIQKVHAALTVLSSVDPKLGDHLEKIAKMATDNPDKYSWALNFL